MQHPGYPTQSPLKALSGRWGETTCDNSGEQSIVDIQEPTLEEGDIRTAKEAMTPRDSLSF